MRSMNILPTEELMWYVCSGSLLDSTQGSDADATTRGAANGLGYQHRHFWQLRKILVEPSQWREANVQRWNRIVICAIAIISFYS